MHVVQASGGLLRAKKKRSRKLLHVKQKSGSSSFAAIFSLVSDPRLAVAFVSPTTADAMDRSPEQAPVFQLEKESYRRSIGDTVQRTFPAYSKSQHLLHVLKLIEGLRQISNSPQQHFESEIVGFCHELEYYLGATSDKRFLDPGSDSEKELASILLTLLLSPFIGPEALPSICSLMLCDQVVVKHCGVQLDWRKTMYVFTSFLCCCFVTI